MTTEIHYTDDPEADALLSENPFALVVGLVLQQQVPVERAFAAPLELRRRLGGELTPSAVAGVPPEELEQVFATKPALHRFPAAMAKRTAAVARVLVERYDGDAANLWTDVSSADELLDRIMALPGFGEYKARILLAILARRFDVRPDGYAELLPDWPSIADVEAPGDLDALKVRKKEWKAKRHG